MTLVEVETLLAPLGATDSCGAEIDYDADYLALERSIEGLPERQYGEMIIPAEAPDWSRVVEQATKLLGKSRDFRLIVILTRGLTRQRGIEGALAGLDLALELARHRWDEAFPRLQFDGEDDPLMRSNALAGMAMQQGLLSDLRAAALDTRRLGAIEFGVIEKVLGGRDSAALPFNRDQIEHLLAEETAHANPALQQLMELRARVVALQTLCRERMGAVAAPDLQPLVGLIDQLYPPGGAAVAQRQDRAMAPGEAAPRLIVAATSSKEMSRQEAIGMLDAVCVYLEQSDPANPAPLLIRRARALIGRDFLSILRELAPDAVAQTEHLAGIRHGN